MPLHTHVSDSKATLQQVARIDVHEDRLAIRLKSAGDEETFDAADDHLLSIPWQKPPSRKSRQILIPHGIPKSEIRPTRIERRARLVSAIARGRRWLPANPANNNKRPWGYHVPTASNWQLEVDKRLGVK
jgi:site-specific DNA recombinase